MVDTHRYAFAELNNDTVPELITGASDETYLHNNKYATAIFPPGNKDRAMRGLNYYFFKVTHCLRLQEVPFLLVFRLFSE